MVFEAFEADKPNYCPFRSDVNLCDRAGDRFITNSFGFVKSDPDNFSAGQERIPRGIEQSG